VAETRYNQAVFLSKPKEPDVMPSTTVLNIENCLHQDETVTAFTIDPLTSCETAALFDGQLNAVLQPVPSAP
jgi:predicted nucleic acid-binding Zn ribbon protein